MIKTGLVSVTFRQKSIEEIVKLAQKAGLFAIEWGGDVHVPHGDLESAKSACRLTKESGLITASYGSYYRAGTKMDFSPVLETALNLQAPNIRVWAFNKGAAETAPFEREETVNDLQECVNLAKKHGITVSCEFHAGTLTDSAEGALKLLSEIEGLKTYWQPQTSLSIIERKQGLEAVLPYITNIHVFNWTKKERLLLEEAKDEWKNYFGLVQDGFALLEFVKDDSEKSFFSDANTLKRMLEVQDV